MKIETAEFVRSAHLRNDLLADGRFEIAFIGRSNVGKSSLMNALLGRKGLARTSSTPGRTRSVNYFLVNGSFYFVDLPGYGYAKAGRADRQSWAELVEGYFDGAAERTDRVAVLQLVDSKVGATPLDIEGRRFMADLGLDAVVVATKVDRIKRGERAKLLSGLAQSLELEAGEPAFAVSAETKEGIKELWSVLDARLRPAR